MPATKNMKRARFLKAYQALQAANRAEMLQAQQSKPDGPGTQAINPPGSSALLLSLIPPNEVSLPPSATASDAGTPPPNTPPAHDHQPPPVPLVEKAIVALEARVNPKRRSGVGHQPSKLNPLALKDLSSVLDFFHLYTSKEIGWRDASLDIARSKGKGKGHAETLCWWGRGCLKDPSYIPRTSYGHNQDPIIKYDEF
ncbi:hypothetical protein RhiLY_10540 [Ceratobasidium sp. AG-Ba]|nr:hypothetical protein RhiLY_10540 [Ceratobasidium sp. AG-Ba]